MTRVLALLASFASIALSVLLCVDVIDLAAAWTAAIGGLLLGVGLTGLMLLSMPARQTR